VRILVAPDKFKGTLNARDAAQNIAKGLLDVLPDAQIEVVPMADGGEGTAEAICDARGCSWLECKAHDPLGREIDARYGWIDQEKLAVMEMSEAAGMRRLSESERDPIRATTFGVGEMLLDATKRGANEIRLCRATFQSLSGPHRPRKHALLRRRLPRDDHTDLRGLHARERLQFTLSFCARTGPQYLGREAL